MTEMTENDWIKWMLDGIKIEEHDTKDAKHKDGVWFKCEKSLKMHECVNETCTVNWQKKANLSHTLNEHFQMESK